MKKCFPFLKTCGSQLEFIDKRHANLVYIPDEVIRNARSIEECFLDANQIKDLPKNFFRLSKIRVLTLSDNDLSYIPESIGNFNHLVELDISRNHIEDIHYNIKFCNELRTLDLSNNPISRLPEGFSSLRNLTYLSLNDISLTELPNDFGNLTVLTRLELRDNCLKTLPNSFSRFQHLELLDLGGNEFQEFPKQLGRLSELKVLCMDNNELQNLPQEIGTLRSLQQLDVSENFLEVICQEIGNLQSLTDFVLSQNSLDSLPNTIGNLKELTVLKIDQNKLISLTSHIGNCTNLQELYLTENLLTKLPGTFGKLSKLTHLNADRNNLNAIPPELSRCNELTIMSFRGNNIRRLPDEIGNMLKLHVLDVSLNQLDRLPLSIAQCPLKALWLSENQSQSIVKLQRDTDENTGVEYLTCYLLPQSGIEDHINLENIIHTEEDESGERNSQVLSTAAGDSDSVNMRITSSTSASDIKVRFFEDEQIPSNRISKELPKTRHPKFDKIAVDGHIIPKDYHINKETKFTPGRPDTEPLDPKTNGKVVPKRTKKVSAPPSMAPTFQMHSIDQMSDSNDESRLRSHSDAGLRPVDIIPIVEEVNEKEGNSVSQSSSSSYSDHSAKKLSETIPFVNKNAEVEVTQPEVKQRKAKPTLRFTYDTQDSSPNESNKFLDVSSPRSSREQAAYSSGGEEIDIISRHVGFSEEVEDNEEASDLKLIRRDTPHYTKKARIQQITADGVKNEDVVKQIMEKLKSPTPSLSQNASVKSNKSYTGSSGHDNSSVQLRHTDNLQISPTYDQVVSASALARGSDVPPGLNYATSESEETNVIIRRQPTEPLGMSIAGGKGSSPYQPVFVSRVTETGAANRCGLRVNDKILEVNGQSMKDVDHIVAVSALKTAGNYINMLVLREVVIAPPPLSSFVATETSSFPQNQNSEDQVDVKFETIKCDIIRDENGLGFSIAGGKGSMRKDVCDQRWAFLESIYICKITPNGAADKCRRLQVGDKIIKINGIDVSDARHDQAVVLLSGSETVINLDVQRQVIVPKSPGDVFEYSNLSKPVSPVSDNSSICGGSFKDRESIRIVKAGGQLGLSICGGSDHYSHPFGLEEPGIFVSKISSNGAAKACGKLRIGDRIVSVNGNGITKATHDQAIFYILQAANELVLDIVHEPPPPGLTKLSILKEINEKLGINIHGGSDGGCMNPDDTRDRGIFITKILPDSAVYRDGRLKVGDRLLEVNGRSFMGVSCSSANKVLREVSTHMEVLVCDGVPAEKITQALAFSNSLMSTTSVSDEYSPTPSNSAWKYSPNPSHHSMHINANNTTPTRSSLYPDNAHDNDNNNYISQNQKVNSSINIEEKNLSFRSKRQFFEKEITTRKN